MVCLSGPYNLKNFKGSLPPILLGQFLNTLSHWLFNLSRITCFKATKTAYPNKNNSAQIFTAK